MNGQTPRATGKSGADTPAAFALHPSALIPELRSWWRTEPHGLWLAAGVVGLGMIGVLIYQARQGYEVWPMLWPILAAAGFFLVAAVLFQFLRVVAYGVLQALKWLGLHDPLMRLASAADSALGMLFKLGVWIVGIGLALVVAAWVLSGIAEEVRTMSTPAAILIGAVIIAYAIAASRGGRGQ